MKSVCVADENGFFPEVVSFLPSCVFSQNTAPGARTILWLFAQIRGICHPSRDVAFIMDVALGSFMILKEDTCPTHIIDQM